MVGGIRCLAAAFQFTFQIPENKFASGLSNTINDKPVYKSGDFISEKC